MPMKNEHAGFLSLLLLFIVAAATARVCPPTRNNTRSNTTSVSPTSSTSVVAGSDDILYAELFGIRPTAVEQQILYDDSDAMEYIMAKGETHGFLLKATVNSSPVDIKCTGSQVSDGSVSCSFFKLWAQYPDNTNKWRRPTYSSSPASGSDAYYDIAVAIPAGSSNFTAESDGAGELIWVDIAVASTASETSNADVNIVLGDDQIAMTLEIANFVMPDAPTMPMLMELSESDIDDGHYGSYKSDADKVNLMLSYTQQLKDHRVMAYKNLITLLDIDTTPNPDDLDIDEHSGVGNGGSFRDMMNLYDTTGWYHTWFANPYSGSPYNTAAYADAARETNNAESLLTSGQTVIYVWDEPGAGDIANVKTAIDAWDSGVNTTPAYGYSKILLTANVSYDNSDDPGGLEWSDYNELVLTPVINHIENNAGGVTQLADYSNALTGYYTSCQGNCQTELNTDSFTGSKESFTDFARIDIESSYARAGYWLTEATTWRSKIIWLLHYAAVEGHGNYDGIKITAVADSSDSLDGKYFILDGGRGSRCFWIDTDDSGTTEPAGCSTADNSTEITAIVTDASAATVAGHINSAIDGSTEFTSYNNSGAIVNVMGDTWDGTQDAGDSGFTVAYDQDTSVWESARRFGVMGDGTLMYPNMPSFKPFTGLSAFAKGNNGSSASLRLKVLRDSSYERDALSTYFTRESTAVADNLITDSDDFDTDWGEYEYLRWRVYKANGSTNDIGEHTRAADRVRFTTQPGGIAKNTSQTVIAEIKNYFGGTVSSTDDCSLTAQGSGTLSVTSPVTAVAGVCTFNDVQLDTAGDYTLTVAVTGLDSGVSETFTVTD
jgi:hypothetical protein